MERRYKIFARVGVRNIISFNARPPKKKEPEDDENLEGAAPSTPNDKGRESARPSTDEIPIPEKMP